LYIHLLWSSPCSLVWQKIGEDQKKRLEELRRTISVALDRVYDKATERSVRTRMALEVSIAEGEKRLKERLGTDALQEIAPRELPLQTRLSMNMSQLQNMDSIFSLDVIRKGTESMHTSSLCKESVSVNVETSLTINNLEANDGPEGVASETTKDQANASNHVSFNKVTVDDALCCCCKRLLYHPIVLNCGHVFCQSCIKISEERTVNCQVCPSIHLGD
jgi:hypothetical protein